MPIPEPASLKRLEIIGIEVWQRRARRADDAGVADTAGRTGEPAASPRVRLASGSGDWLLVTPSAISARYQRLVADLAAAIGPERCRFGQWAGSPVAGTGLDELETRGIHHVLAFGPLPVSAGDCIEAPELEVLASDGTARRELWLRLASFLDG